MDPHQIKQHLTDLVLDGREEVAIEELLAISGSTKKEIRNNIEALSSRYRKFERDKLGGYLNRDKINTTSDRISQALLVIIEQVTEEGESNGHAVDLETLFHDIDESSTEGNILSGGRTKTMIRVSIIVPVCIALIAGVVAFVNTFSKTTNPGEAALNNWLGVWQHQMQSIGNNDITGSLSFEIFDDDEFVGKARNVFPDGSVITNTLSQIQFSRKGKVIEGVWETDIQSLHGTFRLNLDSENRFTGYYTVVNQEGEFYWNGTK